MKPTPGPWVLDRFGAIRGGPMRQYTNGQSQSQIALATLNDISEAEREANARLIAASPELLEACKAAVAALSQPVQFTQPDQRVFDNRPVEILRGDAKFARETLQAAIDKATKGEAE